MGTSAVGRWGRGFWAAAALAGAVWAQGAGVGRGLSFEEEFALGADRKALLAQLIPGSEDFYYYSCLERQHAGDLAAVEPLLRTWIQRHGRGGRVEEIENRQALLRFESDRDGTFRFLRERLGLRFDHQREVPGAKPGLPSQLDPELLSERAWAQRALERHPGTADGFRGAALKRLAEGALDDRMLASLLQRLERPDVANLPALIVRHLALRSSGTFGSNAIHRRLTLAQLEECARLEPKLLGDREFVATWLARLAPGGDEDPHRDRAARLAHLERLGAFVERLAPAFNSLKAHVAYRRLEFDLASGAPSLDRFRAYLKLPRNSPCAHPKLVERASDVANLGESFATGLMPVGDDEPLVRAYLEHFLRDAADSSAFADLVEPRYLARAFAETKILAGAGDMERWYSLLDDPDYYERLKRRVEIRFAPTQPEWFAADAAVAVDVDVKNVPTLIVKVYEIHALNFYEEEQREVDAAIALDGLVANVERTFDYGDSPLRRVRRHFDFPELTRPGVYVVEFIGNGSASRVIVRKGRLALQERIGAAGHVFRVVDEAGAAHPEAVLHFEHRRFTADERGEIVLPFTAAPGVKRLIVEAGERVTLATFDHQPEAYGLRCGVFVEREGLRSGERAKLIVRPALTVQSRLASLSLLEEPVLTIASVDLDGVQSSLDVRGPKLDAAAEFVQEIAVPDRLARLEVKLRGRVKSLVTGEPIELASDPIEFALNAIDPTPHTDCPLLGRAAEGWFLDVLGKSGEPRAHRAVSVRLVHRDYADPLEVTLETDDAGRVRLGALPGVIEVATSGFPTGLGAWRLDRERRTRTASVHGVAGQVVRVPYAPNAERVTRADVSLFEMRGDVPVRDAFENVKLADGYLELTGLAAGDYALEIADTDDSVWISVTAGAARAGWAYGSSRALELTPAAPLHVASLRAEKDELVVRLGGAGSEARVHVFATRYLPAYDPLVSIGAPPRVPADALRIAAPGTDYLEGRDIGDEFRYILERRFARKFPGNLLHRPSLLLNPWALEESETGALGEGGGGSGFRSRRSGGAARGSGGPSAAGPSTQAAPAGLVPDLDFLDGATPLLANLTPDAHGVVRVKLADLGDAQHVHVLALDARERVYASLALPERPLRARDRRLITALDPARHLGERRVIEFVARGAELTLDEGATAQLETYDSLDDVFQYLRTKSGDADLDRFAFLVRWPGLTPEEKRARYSENACHELHFFLYRKDKAFFDQVVRPYLANKLDKTFLDRWLLGEALERYLDPWAFAQLNVVERILLAQRLGDENGARHVRELFELLPPDVAGDEERFSAALAGFALAAAESGVGRYKGANEPRPPGAPAAAPALEQEEARKEKGSKDQAPREDAKNLAGGEEALADEVAGLESDALLRARMQRLYVPVAATQVFAESHWWHRRIFEQDASLIEANAFWRDFADAAAGQPFVSTSFTVATRNVAEMLMALAVLDLPFTAGEHGVETAAGVRKLHAASPLLVVKKELRDSPPAAQAAPLLVSQDFYRLDDRYEFTGNERREKFVRDEFLSAVAYGCRVVVTNPTSSARELELLLQIPAGSVPVENGRATRGLRVRLDPYGTQSVEYAFYFPRTGRFAHYPVHVSQAGELVAFAPAAMLDVVAEPSRVDSTSWEFVSQRGSTADVLAFLGQANLQRLDVERAAWRMRERSVFDSVTALLRQRLRFEPTLWSYALLHGDVGAAREYLRWRGDFLTRCGPYLDSPLAKIDPVERRAYEHLEFDPLVNPRAHPFGRGHEILNAGAAAQYQALLAILVHRPRLDDHDWLSVTYYLLLQDRVEEALATFAKIDPARLEARIQFDYLSAYLDFFSDDHALARGIAERYREYPVARWRALFADVVSQLDEAAGAKPSVRDDGDRDQRQGALAAGEPAVEVELEGRRVKLAYRNVASCEVSYYPMDVEFLFSAQPFVQQDSRAFAFIRPVRADTIALPAGRAEHAFDLPAELANANVLIEVRAGGLVRRKPCLQAALRVQWLESYGQVAVARTADGAPLSKVYVKVYAKRADGSVRFHKDGYTDLRGRFDYASLSGPEASDATRFAVLVASDTDGAVIGEVAPPAR